MTNKNEGRVTCPVSESPEPFFQDRDDLMPPQEAAGNMSEIQALNSSTASNALSTAEYPSLLCQDAYPRYLDSQDQLSLYDLVRRHVQPDHILNEFVRHFQAGKRLPWFEQVIPELRPGVQSDAEWLPAARALLWDESHKLQHEQGYKRIASLRKSLPAILSDEYGLRDSWSFIVKVLQPMSKDMAIAIDVVSCLLGRSDCLLLAPDRKWSQAPSGVAQSNHIYVVLLQALQDKILSPIIEDLAKKIKDLDPKVGNDREHDADQTESSQQQSEPAHVLAYMIKLKKALENLRTIIVADKDERDRGTGK